MTVHKHHLLALLVTAVASGHALSADLTKAKQNYERYCAACHGFNGMSLSPGTPNLRMNEGLIQSDLQILQKLKMGSPKKAPMLGILNDQELLDVITYSRTIR